MDKRLFPARATIVGITLVKKVINIVKIMPTDITCSRNKEEGYWQQARGSALPPASRRQSQVSLRAPGAEEMASGVALKVCRVYGIGCI